MCWSASTMVQYTLGKSLPLSDPRTLGQCCTVLTVLPRSENNPTISVCLHTQKYMHSSSSANGSNTSLHTRAHPKNIKHMLLYSNIFYSNQKIKVRSMHCPFPKRTTKKEHQVTYALSHWSVCKHNAAQSSNCSCSC